jgi:hypothetical protein
VKLLVTKILIFLYITTSTQFSQLYKLPIFVSHFIEHVQKDKLGSISEEMVFFIEHHYGGHEQDEDWQTDQKLPFIKIEISHVDHSYLPIITFEVPQLNKEVHQEHTLKFYEEQFSSDYLDSIWQPPKQA